MLETACLIYLVMIATLSLVLNIVLLIWIHWRTSAAVWIRSSGSLVEKFYLRSSVQPKSVVHIFPDCEGLKQARGINTHRLCLLRKRARVD